MMKWGNYLLFVIDVKLQMQLITMMSFSCIYVLYCWTSFADICAHDLMCAAADCRSLFGGPLNPKFDVCKTINDSLLKVR